MKKNVLTTLVKDLATRVLGSTDSVADWHGKDVALRQQYEAAQAERGQLLGAKPPRADIMRALEAEIQQLGAAWRGQRGEALAVALTGVLDVAPDGRVLGILKFATLADEPVTVPMLCALAPDVIAKGFGEGIISRLDYEAGPPLAERTALVAALHERLAGLEAAHAQHVDDAAEHGIVLQHLPATVFARGRAAREQEAWARDGLANASYYAQHPDRRPPAPTEAAR
jgi:hypothetical protein